MGGPPVTRTSIEDIAAGILGSRWFLGLVSVAILGLLALASWPWSFNRFVLKATTRTIEISTSARGALTIDANFPKGNEIQIYGANPDGLPPELTTLADATSAIRLAVSSATLQISLPTDGTLIVRMTSDGAPDIGVLNNGVIHLTLAGMIERIEVNGQRTAINIERATSWNIRARGKDILARVVLPPNAGPIALYTIALYNQPISDFWFRYPRIAGDDPRTYQSEILTGQLQILDTGAKIKLQPRELILLEGGSRMLSRLEIIDKAVAVDVSGEANRISVGPPRPGSPFSLDRDLTPSVLSYLLNQHELKVLWGIALTLLGALWKARQWALKWAK